jgi:hypothetical protein
MLLPLVLHQHRQTAAGENPSSLRALFRRYGQMAKLSFFVLWTTLIPGKNQKPKSGNNFFNLESPQQSSTQLYFRFGP